MVIMCLRPHPGGDAFRFEIVPLTDGTIERAIMLLFDRGKAHRPRTLDALQIASAQAVEGSGPIFVAADRSLLSAAAGLFARVVDPEAAP